ncbi:MAG: hypothetical protein LBG15_12315, partial [Dysgonamonadaceae bacterium]|nr:hypothetical protein [Dysgonamonadaceae bacterium]
METLRKIIDSKALETLFPLPKSFQNRDIEIIILPVNEKREKPHVTRQMIDEMLPGSITQSLIGAIPSSNISLDDIR